VEVRGGPEQPWRPASGYIAPAADGRFRAEVDSALLAGQAEIRLRAVGADGKPVGLSQPLEAGSPCERGPTKLLNFHMSYLCTSALSQPPREVSLIRLENWLLLRWSFPQPRQPSAIDECQLHFLVGGLLDGAALQRTVDGRARELRLESSSGQARLSVHAVNRLGAGPASIPVQIGDGSDTAEMQAQKSTLTAPDAQPSSAPLFLLRRLSRSFPGPPPTPALSARHRRRRDTICDPRTDFWCRPNSFSVDDRGDGPRHRGIIIEEADDDDAVPCCRVPPFPPPSQSEPLILRAFTAISAAKRVP
jgi:hypothetical protein